MGGAAKSYPTAMVVDSLPTVLNNTSTLFYWQGGLWTSNDHGGMVLYELDSLTGNIVRQLPSEDTLAPFSDMEEVTQDDAYFYFGDFGNNHERLRDDLRILRLSKASLMAGLYLFDTIFFTYEGYDPSLHGREEIPTTDYDCEAMVATGDSLYLFTKQWSSMQTTCYALPKQPGRYTAYPKGSADVYGLVTGACFQPDRRLLVFSCYTPLCQPFIYLLYDFNATDFFAGEHLRLPLNNNIGIQIEAITTADGLHYYLTNEHFSHLGINYPAQLLELDLSDYLGGYLHPDTAQLGIASPRLESRHFALSPNPAINQVEVSALKGNAIVSLSLFDARGVKLLEQTFPQKVDRCCLDVSHLLAGSYVMRVSAAGGYNEELHLVVQ